MTTEPTEEMLQAALDADVGELDTPLRDLYRLIYMAMSAKALPPSIALKEKTALEKNMTAMLRSDEGEVLHAYQDHLGFWTIGIGILIDKKKGGGITREESEYLFMNRLRSKTTELSQRLPWFAALDDARKGVLCSMAFQMGVDGLLGFANTLKLVEAGDYAGAARGMLQSKWAQQTPERAKRMAEQMKTGAWQIQ